MPQEFPRVDLEHPSDIDFIINAILRYATDIGKESLRARGRGAAALEGTLEQALARWVYAARARLIPNVHINGMSLSDYAKQSAAMEPFDEGLAQRVHTLSSQVDETTERVVACRKNLPSAYARAVQRRAEARSALADAKEEQRQRRMRKTRTRAPFPALARGQPLYRSYAQLTPVDTAAKKRSESTLDAVGSAIAKIAGYNAARHTDAFEPTVNMYVYEEVINGKKLTDIINKDHVNTKYLPHARLPDNVVAVPKAEDAARGATLLVFVLPHQFILNVCKSLKNSISPQAHAISMIKGVEVADHNISIYADVIEKALGIPCAALSGANIANEVAAGLFSETTVGYRPHQRHLAEYYVKLFDTPKFRVGTIEDVAGVSLCGALKNIIAIGAGLVDGLGWGGNAKAAIMRIGLMEMRRFSLEFFDNVRPETFTETSAGVADLITTCYGGRNRKCAEAFVKTRKPFHVLEAELLNGQKLQGTETAKDVYEFLRARGKVDEYPLMRTIYEICFEGVDPTQLTERL
ncbi:glycerol-3-phosphate dehydrogenase (NAD(+)) [Malassezia caprae]|uniref:Glycerol-3-phosphate dehydrogenase [NAD(+)] n=1 Tax=Malassezia caprae TaxID=1381934 RepID=A0AAF0E8H9_9BASI|nr:glycerol-3-phosphate dehydrogenase (NAD(+)) [Malassezia caprae]